MTEEQAKERAGGKVAPRPAPKSKAAAAVPPSANETEQRGAREQVEDSEWVL